MIIKSEGIVIGYIKYRESSIIARVFTEEIGYASFIVNAIRNQKSKKSIGYFQPFSLLDMVIYFRESREIQRISEFKSTYPLHSIHQDLIKSSVTFFLSEVLSKILHTEVQSNKALFNFISSSIKYLDIMSSGVENFHIQFLLKISEFLGYGLIDLEALFISANNLVKSGISYEILAKMRHSDYGILNKMNGEQRNDILHTILNFYRHYIDLGKINSIDILRRILA